MAPALLTQVGRCQGDLGPAATSRLWSPHCSAGHTSNLPQWLPQSLSMAPCVPSWDLSVKMPLGGTAAAWGSAVLRAYQPCPLYTGLHVGFHDEMSAGSFSGQHLTHRAARARCIESPHKSESFHLIYTKIVTCSYLLPPETTVRLPQPSPGKQQCGHASVSSLHNELANVPAKQSWQLLSEVPAVSPAGTRCACSQLALESLTNPPQHSPGTLRDAEAALTVSRGAGKWWCFYFSRCQTSVNASAPPQDSSTPLNNCSMPMAVAHQQLYLLLSVFLVNMK